MIRPHAALPAGRLRFVVAGCVLRQPRQMAACARLSRVRIARKFLRGIYAAVTLFAGDVFFNEIGVL